MAPIPCQRALFDIPREVAYFDCAKMSPLLRSAAEAGVRGLLRKAQPWEIRSENFFDESDRVRGLFARLIGASADDVAIIPSVSYGMASVLQNVAVAPRQSIVTLADDFPSTVYAARSLAGQAEARLVTVACPEDGDWTPAILDAIDGSTALVCAPNVHWIDGGLIDVSAIARRCRSVGAVLVLDTTQSTGALPIDVAEVDPDYLVGASYKWLLGPYSLGFLYAAPRHQQGRPLEQGWIARSGARDFQRLTDYDEALEPNARRFDMGERSNFALLPVAGAAIEQLLEWGVGDVAETLGQLTGRIEEGLACLGIVSPAPAKRAPHYLSVRFPTGLPPGIAERLAEANVHVSLRGDRMRITPHLYNDEEDIERLVASLASSMHAKL
jgi:selenocysteine lyase/cysteine desulfurase